MGEKQLRNPQEYSIQQQGLATQHALRERRMINKVRVKKYEEKNTDYWAGNRNANWKPNWKSLQTERKQYGIWETIHAIEEAGMRKRAERHQEFWWYEEHKKAEVRNFGRYAKNTVESFMMMTVIMMISITK